MKRLHFRKKIKMKGLKVPRFLVSLLGKYHARRGCVGIGKEGFAQSGYIERKMSDFVSYTSLVYDKLEKEFLEDCIIEEQLITELKQLNEKKRNLENCEKELEWNYNSQTYKNCQREKKTVLLRKEKIIYQLLSIYEKMETGRLCVKEKNLSVSEKLQALLMSYCQGAFRKKEWKQGVVPFVEIENQSFKMYDERHKEENEYLKRKVQEVIKE